MISIMILQAHGAKGHGAQFIAPMSQVRRSLSAILYVNDDTNLLHLNMEGDESVQEVHMVLQWSIENWGKLLIAMGGTFKPDKFFFHLLDLVWTKSGGWQYVAHHEDDAAAITVPMPDGTMAPIAHKAVDDAQKTLGVVTCPLGNSMGSLQQMKEKTQKWLDSLTASRLHRQMMWFSIDCQLWPLINYGFCCNMATLPKLETVLSPFYDKMLPLGGLVCKANRGIRQLDRGFYRAGFPHPGVKPTMEQLNKLLMHYGCHTALGTELQILLELLVADLGLTFQPFCVSNKHYGNWVTTCWLKRVWEKVNCYGFVLTVKNLVSIFPREGDDWLMARFIAVGYKGEELLTLNKVRKHQQVLFLLDILGASGGSVDKRYLQRRRIGEWWSSMTFPCKEVTESEMGLWCRAIAQVVLRGPEQASLGRLKSGGHKVWDWRVQESKDCLYRERKNCITLYKHIRHGQYERLRTS